MVLMNDCGPLGCEIPRINLPVIGKCQCHNSIHNGKKCNRRADKVGNMCRACLERAH